MKRFLIPGLLLVASIYSCNFWRTAQPFVEVRPVSLQTRAEAARLEQQVRTLVERWPRRHAHNSEELSLAGSWIEQRIAELGLSPSRQTYTAGGQSYFNVLARLGPETGKSIVVGAHYDVFSQTLGADDNASGVAALLELTRVLASHPPRCPVELAFWTLEEPPYFRTSNMGSAHHAKRLREQGVELHFALSVEMVGYFNDAQDSQKYPPTFPFRIAYPSAGNFILLLSDLGTTGKTRQLKGAFMGGTPVEIRSVNVPRKMSGADFSDHLNFWQSGYTAFMLTDTAFLRNPNYHLESDRPETLDYRRMAQVVDGIAAAVLDGCTAKD